MDKCYVCFHTSPFTRQKDTRNEFGYDNEPILLRVHIDTYLHRYLKLVDVFKNSSIVRLKILGPISMILCHLLILLVCFHIFYIHIEFT